MRIWILLFLTFLLIACESDRKPVQSRPDSKVGDSAAATPSPSSTPSSEPLNLVGTEWHLEDLGGTGVIDNSRATLAFPDAGRVAGNSSCNRFMGTVTIDGNSLKFGPLAGTRMACTSEAVSNQEMRYLKALEHATRYEWKDPYLLVYVDGMDKPLKYTRMQEKEAPAQH